MLVDTEDTGDGNKDNHERFAEDELEDAALHVAHEEDVQGEGGVAVVEGERLRKTVGMGELGALEQTCSPPA